MTAILFRVSSRVYRLSYVLGRALYILFLLCYLLFVSFKAQAQRPPSYPQINLGESVIVLPYDYQPTKRYPLLVLMPYTGGSSFDFFRKYARELDVDSLNVQEQFRAFLEVFQTEFGQEKSFILMLTQGAGSRKHHSFTGFWGCIESYERRVLRDLKKFVRLYNIEPTQVYIGGVSLGGDLSWALSMRDPTVFQGALVMGSRCSYPVDSNIQHLADKNYSYFMVMGMDEAPDRLSGMSYARQQLAAKGINYAYREMPYLEHDRAPIWLFQEGIDYVMFQKHQTLHHKKYSPLHLKALLDLHEGELAIKSYTLGAQEEILQKGDGIWLLQKDSLVSPQRIRIYERDSAQFYIQFQNSNLPELKCYLSGSNNAQIIVDIPEQDIQGYKYRGIGQEIDAPYHGVLMYNKDEKYVSFDFESYKIGQTRQRKTYSFFVLLQ